MLRTRCATSKASSNIFATWNSILFSYLAYIESNDTITLYIFMYQLHRLSKKKKNENQL